MMVMGWLTALDSDCPACASSEDCTTYGDEDGNGLADCADGCTTAVTATGSLYLCEMGGETVVLMVQTMTRTC